MVVTSLIYKGGIVMIPIILGSVIALAIVINRINYFRSIRMDEDVFIDKIHSLVRKGEIAGAVDKCSGIRHPLAAVFRSGLQNIHRDRIGIERVMERTGNMEIVQAEKYMLLLVVIIGVEPMLGFLGTIIGLINSFMAWERFAASVTVDFLAAGIYQAMITTASGLIVAIPYYIIYHVITGRINSMARNLNHQSEEFLDLLQEKRKD